MKKLFLLIAVLATFAACKKEEKVEPAAPAPYKQLRFVVMADSAYNVSASGAVPFRDFNEDMLVDTSFYLPGMSASNATMLILSPGFNTGYIYLDDVLLVSRASEGGTGNGNFLHCVIP